MSKLQWAFAFLVIAACGVLAVAWPAPEAPAVGVVVLRQPAARPLASNAPGTGSAPSSTLPGAELGAPPNPRFQLLRVAPPSRAGAHPDGEALIAVDGLPPKAYRVGDVVVGAVVLQSVQPDGAVLGPAGGSAAVVLTIGPAAAPSASSGGAPTTAGASAVPAILPATAPAVDRSPVPVTDPDHGVDTSNH